MKKIPMRMCVICREKKNKSELIRIVNNAEDGVCVDASGKMNGRGAYVCTDAACIENPKARKAL
ncbi:MAG: RNase P modulator RnpM, partial [Eubacterium aggregans]